MTTRRGAGSQVLAPEAIDAEALAHLGGHLAVIHRRVRRADEVALLPHGLSCAQSRALRSLARFDRPMHMRELADVLDVVPRSATSVIDELEPLGLVARRADPNDGRGVLVTLTRRGRTLIPALREAHGRAVASVLRPLDVEEIATLAALLRQLAHTPDDE